MIFLIPASAFSQNVQKAEGNREIMQIDSLNLRSRELSFVDPMEAAKLTTEALKLSNQWDYPPGLAYAYRNLASVHSTEGYYFLSMEYIQRAIEIFSTTNDSIGIGNCYISLGHLYRRLNDREEELFYHKNAYQIFLNLNMKERIGVTAHNLGETYLNVGDIKKSEELTKLAISINDSLGNTTVLSSCYKVMGRIYFERKDYVTAKNYFLAVLRLSEALGKNSQKLATAESMIYLAFIGKATNMTNEYARDLEHAIVFARQNRLHKQLDVLYTELISYYTSIADVDRTQHYVEDYKSFLHDRSIESSKNTTELLNSVVMVHKLELERKALQQDSLAQNQRIQLRNIILAIVACAALIGFWLAFRLLHANNKIRTINDIMRSQADTIAKQLIELETLNATKDKFFSIVAHDIKAPLNSLKVFASLLSDHIEDMTKTDISNIGKQLGTSVDNTMKMADDLIVWAKIQMGTIEVEKSEVCVDEIVSEVKLLYQQIAIQKDVTFSYSAEPRIKIHANREQLLFIVRNLVNNAIKYTNSTGSVAVRAYATENEKVKIAVIDSGIGMSVATQQKLFKLGQVRSVNGTAGETGTGLGLMLAYEFAKLNDLLITFTSNEGVGTEFQISSVEQ